MATILHHEGKFILYSTTGDCVVSPPLTERQLRRLLVWRAIKDALREIPQRIRRAKLKGTSDRRDKNLADTVFLNSAGSGYTNLSPEQFVEAYFINPDGKLPLGRNLDEEEPE